MRKNNTLIVSGWLSKKTSRLQEKGFTILEVLVSFAILAVVMAGMGMAMTASMRLGTAQKQRSTAQDVTREVISSYIKNKDYWVINPFFNADKTLKVADVTVFTVATPKTQVLYDGSVNPPITHWPETYLQDLNGALKSLRKPTLEILYTPIKKTSTEYYTTQVNVMVRLAFNGNKVVEMPTVIGEGDITRAKHAALKDPVVPSVSGQDCALETQDPTSYSSGICCSGYTLNTGTGLCEVSAPTCGLAGQAPVSGLCCMGTTLNTGTGLCEAPAPTCGTAGQAPVSGLCCTGTTLNTGTGLCEATCGSAGQLPVSGSCCSGLFAKPSTGFCTAIPSCTLLNQFPADNNNASCCMGLTLTAGQCVVAPTCLPNGTVESDKTKCCSGKNSGNPKKCSG